ncbi:MAG: hypothetical protein K9G11_00200 [Rickettsiaceae bacterium]|nr:hypothetical protein [Rickettsiaceae bacterium]
MSNGQTMSCKKNIELGDHLILGFYGVSKVDSEVKQAKELLKLGKIRGVILFKDNIISPRQLKSLISFLKTGTRKDIIIAVDQEGGKVSRINQSNGFEFTLKAADQYKDTQEVYSEFYKIGKILSDVGVTLNLAPVLDVNVNLESPAIGKIGRSFSSNPQIVATYGATAIKGLKDNKVDSCGKHFPGHGSATNDSHLGWTDISDTWNREVELFPFIALQKQLPYIMVAHVYNKNLDAALPASLSPKVYNMLPNYTGKFITDCYFMKAIAEKYQEHEFAYKAIIAGADLVIFGRSINAILELNKPLLPLKIFVGNLHDDFNNLNCLSN